MYGSREIRSQSIGTGREKSTVWAPIEGDVEGEPGRGKGVG